MFVMPSQVHIAIMKKSWGLIPKILSGQKTIESRWYRNRARPWGRVHSGDTVYFKNAGEPVTAKATVIKVLQFENLTPAKTRKILAKYGPENLGISGTTSQEILDYCQGKKYGLLVFLKNPRQVKPFHLDKTGFGAMSAWITVDELKQLRVG